MCFFLSCISEASDYNINPKLNLFDHFQYYEDFLVTAYTDVAAIKFDS